jgi:hypothetical protein
MDHHIINRKLGKPRHFGVCAQCGPTKVWLVRYKKLDAAKPQCSKCGGTNIWPKRLKTRGQEL